MSQDFPEDPERFEIPPSFFPVNPDGDSEEVLEDLGEPVLVTVEAVYVSSVSGEEQQFVVLTDGQDRKLPIVIGTFEAASIGLVLSGQVSDRPTPYDLLKTIIEKSGSELRQVVIDDIWGSTYYAKLHMTIDDEEQEIDSRPSDAIALAVRFDADIFVVEGILALANR